MFTLIALVGMLGFAGILGFSGVAGFVGFVGIFADAFKPRGNSNKSSLKLVEAVGKFSTATTTSTAASTAASATSSTACLQSAYATSPSRSKGYAGRITDSTYRPDDPFFEREHLHSLHEAAMDDKVTTTGLPDGTATLQCFEVGSADDFMEKLDWPLLGGGKSLVTKTPDGAYQLRVADATSNQCNLIKQSGITIAITPPCATKTRKTIVLVVRGNIKIHLKEAAPTGIDRPRVLVVSLGGNPLVQAEGVDLYFIGDGQARIVNCTAHMYGRSRLIGGRNSQIALYDESESFQCEGCRIHAYDSSVVRVGIKCAVFLYGDARALTDGKDTHYVGRAHYDRSSKLVVDSSRQESRAVEIRAAKHKKRTMPIAA
jgi:hypothetical protein